MAEISRRELLRKGAILGGSVMWVTPVVQTVGMGRALGQTELVSLGGERCLSADLTPPGPNGVVPDPTNFPNKYRFSMVICNCGPLRIHDIVVSLRVVSLAVNGGSPFDPGITWIPATNVGDLEPVMPNGVQDCFTNVTDQNIKNSFSSFASSGDSIEYTVRFTAKDSFGPVSDDETYQAVIV